MYMCHVQARAFMAYNDKHTVTQKPVTVRTEGSSA